MSMERIRPVEIGSRFGELLKDLVKSGFHLIHVFFHLSHSVEDCKKLVHCFLAYL